MFMLVANSNAQTKKEIKGGTNYKKFSYSKAINNFETAEAKTLDSKRQLGESYYLTGDIKKASSCWEEVATASDAKQSDLYRYSFMLRADKNYIESDKWLQKYGTLATEDSRVKEYQANEGAIERLQKDENRFILYNLDINSSQQDFCATYYKDNIVFASTRAGVNPIVRRWNGNGLAFLNIYEGKVDQSGQIKSIKPFCDKLNKKYHDGPATFSKDGRFMIFTRNNYNAKATDGTTNLEMYSAEYLEGKWQKETPYKFNNKEYSIGQPSLSFDGKTLYFTSNMKGGFGGTDVYKSVKQADGTWGAPQNLGPNINTEGNEMFPFYHESGILFFASDGHVGLGGLDIFLSKLIENNFDKPINIGSPANTNFDDFAFVIDEKMKTGYLSSNRAGGKGDDDIYSFTLLKPFIINKAIKGVTKDNLGNIIANVIVKLFDDSGNEIKSVISGEDGAFNFTIEPEKNYKLNGNKEKYKEGVNTVNKTEKEDIIIADLILEKDPGITLYGLITDKENNLPIAGVEIELTNNFSKTTEIIETSTSGDFLKILSENKLNDSISYNLTIKKEGYLTKIIRFDKLLDKSKQYDIHEELDLTMFKNASDSSIEKFVHINTIYFDLNKYDIRPDAALELDKVIAIMNMYPTLEIELRSHTDCRAGVSYNKILSENRAKSSASYIQSKITNPQRIYGKGYGSTKPVNDCNCSSKLKKVCTEDAYQQNRRTEFIIIKR